MGLKSRTLNSIVETENRIMVALNINFLFIWLKETKVFPPTYFKMVLSLIEYFSKYMYNSPVQTRRIDHKQIILPG